MIIIHRFLGKRNDKLVRSAENLTVQHVWLFVLPFQGQGANELRCALPSGGNAMGQRTPCLGQNYPKSRLDSAAWASSWRTTLQFKIRKKNTSCLKWSWFNHHLVRRLWIWWMNIYILVEMTNIQLLLQLHWCPRLMFRRTWRKKDVNQLLTTEDGWNNIFSQ